MVQAPKKLGAFLFYRCWLDSVISVDSKRPAARKDDKTLAELASEFAVHPNQITEWKQQLQQHAADVFGGSKTQSPDPDIKAMHAKIGQLSLENDPRSSRGQAF